MCRLFFFLRVQKSNALLEYRLLRVSSIRFVGIVHDLDINHCCKNSRFFFRRFCHLLRNSKQIKWKYCNRFALVFIRFIAVCMCSAESVESIAKTDFRVEEKRVKCFQHRNKNRIRHYIKDGFIWWKIKAKCDAFGWHTRRKHSRKQTRKKSWRWLLQPPTIPTIGRNIKEITASTVWQHSSSVVVVQ